MYKSHYIPQFILKSFGNHFDLFDVKEQKMYNGLTSTQAFVIKGLYDNDVERILNTEHESVFYNFIKVPKYPESTEYNNQLSHVRDYIILSYLRTPFVANFFNKDESN